VPRNWITIRVELLGGRGIECNPSPGRAMLVGPHHTFRRPRGLDQSFARWDLSHPVTSTVGVGDRFVYVFDLGDDWRHACEVETTDVDPADAYGIVPPTPVPIWGWGWIPDQYGRRLPDDDGEEEWELRWVKTPDGADEER